MDAMFEDDEIKENFKVKSSRRPQSVSIYDIITIRPMRMMCLHTARRICLGKINSYRN